MDVRTGLTWICGATTDTRARDETRNSTPVSGAVTIEYCLDSRRDGLERSRRVIYDGIQKADLQPADGRTPNHVPVDETVIRINDEQFWQYAAAGPDTNDLLHLRLFSTTTTALTEIFLRELRQKHDVELLCFWLMALNTSKLRWTELASDFKLNEMEIEMPSNESFENSNAEIPRSQTVSAILSLKPPKIGSKHLPPGSMLQTKHYPAATPKIFALPLALKGIPLDGLTCCEILFCTKQLSIIYFIY